MTTQVYNTSLISYKDKLPTVLSVQLSANECVLQLYDFQTVSSSKTSLSSTTSLTR